MKKIIFLDFDGVMDTAYYDHSLSILGLPQTDKWGPVFDPKCIENLQTIINATGADIVVSSTWKDSMTYQEILEMWKERNLPGFVTDVTPTMSSHRGQEIDEWLFQCKRECRYVIIDDLDSYNFNDDQMPYLLCVSPFDGLTEDIAARAIDILNH